MFVRGLLGLGVAALSMGGPAKAQTPFYQATAADLAGPAGSLIRQEPVAGSPAGSVAIRFLYRTTKADGAPIAGSGIVIMPDQPLPTQDRPVIVWAHPTTGVMPPCAPTISSTFFEKVQGLKDMLARGYVVVAPDYPGLGTVGPHAYLIGEDAARSILDSVRAVRGLPVKAGDRFAVWGHSQGGHAAIYTGLVAERYAPELRLVGVAAAAPATDLGALLRDDYETSVGKILTAMALRSWARALATPIDQVVASGEIGAVERVGSDCIESRLEIYEAAISEIPLQRKFLSVPDMTAIEPWKDIILRNTPGPLPRTMPLMMIQGTADTIVRPDVTASYVRSQCEAGGAVRFLQMPGIGHNPLARDTAPAAVQWMADRFAALAAPNDCESLKAK